MEHLEEPSVYLSLFQYLCSLGIQNKEARSNSSSLMSIRNEDRTDLWLTRISSLESAVGVYVGLPDVSFIPSSLIRQSRYVFLQTNTVSFQTFSTGTTTNLSWMSDKSPNTAVYLKTEGAVVLIDPCIF